MSDASIPTDTHPRQALNALIERGEGSSATATMLRVLLLRDAHPDARITTEPARIEDDVVVIRAVIMLGNGASGSGIAATRPEDGSSWAADVEQTETNAIARALDILGYPLRIPTPESREARPSPAPDTIPGTGQSHTQTQPQTQTQTPPVPERTSERRINESAPKVVEAMRRANQRPPASPPPTPGPAPSTAPAAPEPEPETATASDSHLAEFSWNAFWSQARSLGLTPNVVTEKLGRPANQMTPKDAVAGLIEAGAWPDPDDEE